VEIETILLGAEALWLLLGADTLLSLVLFVSWVKPAWDEMNRKILL